MVRNYDPKTDRGKADGEIMQRAVEAVRKGSSVRKAAADYNVNRTTLARYLKKSENKPATSVTFKPAYNSRQVGNCSQQFWTKNRHNEIE